MGAGINNCRRGKGRDAVPAKRRARCGKVGHEAKRRNVCLFIRLSSVFKRPVNQDFFTPKSFPQAVHSLCVSLFE